MIWVENCAIFWRKGVQKNEQDQARFGAAADHDSAMHGTTHQCPGQDRRQQNGQQGQHCAVRLLCRRHADGGRRLF